MEYETDADGKWQVEAGNDGAIIRLLVEPSEAYLAAHAPTEVTP
ncbi:MAG: hypothetical protein WCX64_04840 [Candidatus Micrarchaeia archaeon]|jgi:hypothetical protein